MPTLTETEIRELLKREEGQFLEFKSLWDFSADSRRTLNRRKVRDTIAEYIAAFANADGGTLILGVEDDGTPTGHGYPEEVIDDFLKVHERRLRPSAHVRSQRISLDSQEIVLFDVMMHSEAVMVDGNGYPYRIGDRVIREPQETINARKQAYLTVGYERRIAVDATIEDLDLELAASFMGQGPYRERDVRDALQVYGLVQPKRGGMAVTNAALLLFGQRPFAPRHPRAGIRFFRVRGREKLHGSHRNVEQLGNRLEPPLARLLQEARDFAAGQVRNSEQLHNLFFREMPEYPTYAWQEALVNAIAHRDYNDQGREIEMTFFDDRLEISSPGGLVPPVTLELLQQGAGIHAARNPLIVRMLADAGIMRDEGEGIPRMFEEMKESWLRPPEFQVEHETLTVTFRNDPVFDGASREWQRIINEQPLSVNQRRSLLAYPDGFGNEEYRLINKMDRDTAYREIDDLVRRGILDPPGKAGRGAWYAVTERLRQRRSWLDRRLPAIRIHFQSNRELTNGDYRTLFDITRATALRELQRLCDEGYLVARGARRGAHYISGPALG